MSQERYSMKRPRPPTPSGSSEADSQQHERINDFLGGATIDETALVDGLEGIDGVDDPDLDFADAISQEGNLSFEGGVSRGGSSGGAGVSAGGQHHQHHQETGVGVHGRGLNQGGNHGGAPAAVAASAGAPIGNGTARINDDGVDFDLVDPMDSLHLRGVHPHTAPGDGTPLVQNAEERDVVDFARSVSQDFDK